MASASSQSLIVDSGIDLPVSLYCSAPAGASVKRNSRLGVVASIRRSIVERRRHHLRPDAVAGQHGDVEGGVGGHFRFRLTGVHGDGVDGKLAR